MKNGMRETEEGRDESRGMGRAEACIMVAGPCCQATELSEMPGC